MEKAVKDMHEEMTFNHLPYGIRFFMFLNRIKFRIFVFVTLGSLFSYWGNLLGLATSKLERVFKKYKRRWIFKYNRPAMTYQTTLETRYEPERLSRASTEKLSQLFIKLDRELEYGFSRGLVADTLITMKLMDNVGKEEATFLDASGYNYIRSKKLNSMSLREYLEILEKKFVLEAKNELECVDTFIRLVEEDKEAVSHFLCIKLYLTIVLS